MGHRLTDRPVQGSAHTIAVDPATGMLTGISDFRRGGRPAALSSGTLALWDFADPAGTQLSVTRHLGDYQWSSDIAGSVTDGRDHFRIRRDSPAEPMQAYLDLREAKLTKVAVEIKITAAQFAGLMPNEQLRITFAHGKVIPRVTARMVFGRSERHQIILRGEASAGGTSIAPYVISENLQLSRPVVIRMELDTDSDQYAIASRELTEVDFTVHGTGRVAAKREANYLGLNALNDFSAEKEFLEIDRVELLRLNLQKSEQ